MWKSVCCKKHWLYFIWFTNRLAQINNWINCVWRKKLSGWLYTTWLWTVQHQGQVYFQDGWCQMSQSLWNLYSTGILLFTGACQATGCDSFCQLDWGKGVRHMQESLLSKELGTTCKSFSRRQSLWSCSCFTRPCIFWSVGSSSHLEWTGACWSCCCVRKLEKHRISSTLLLLYQTL